PQRQAGARRHPARRRRPPAPGARQGGAADRDRAPAAPPPHGARRPGADARPAPLRRLGVRRGHRQPHRGHPHPAPPPQAGIRGRPHRDGDRRRLPAEALSPVRLLSLPPKLRLAPLWPALAAVVTATLLLWSLLPSLLQRTAAVQLFDMLDLLAPIARDR